jgi:alkanesulfonate monooxygenase SsuD/methylene tetrahydromethanopterin reductase-like flavin-dependent oxidoreductase (luciferase family)
VTAKKLDVAWAEAGRDGKPRKMALSYFALGDRAEEDARGYLTDYYAWLGKEVADYITAGAAKDAESVRRQVAAFEAAGCDELIFFPSSSDPAQVDLLADAVAG